MQYLMKNNLSVWLSVILQLRQYENKKAHRNDGLSLSSISDLIER
jgi:hypothetical protein